MAWTFEDDGPRFLHHLPHVGVTQGALLTSVLNEIAESASLALHVEEKLIPVREDVRAACEILGLDPLQVACEGRFAPSCPNATPIGRWRCCAPIHQCRHVQNRQGFRSTHPKGLAEKHHRHPAHPGHVHRRATPRIC